MDNLARKIDLLLKHLSDENIIDADIQVQNLTFQKKLQLLRQKLQEEYPQTQLKRMMKSIHYANAFSDKNLKQSAFVLDEIEQYLSINKFLNHDIAVDYFNNKITSDGVTITPNYMVEVMIESLLLSRSRK